MTTTTETTTTEPETRPMTFHEKYHERGHGCPLCGKALKAHEKRRYIHVGEGGASILRADLPIVMGVSGEQAVLSTGPDTGEMGWYEVGSGCARKLGAAWHKELPPITG